MKRLKSFVKIGLLILLFSGQALFGHGQDLYPKEWVLYMKKMGKENFYVSFPSDPSFHVKKGSEGGSYIELESSQKGSSYRLEVYPLEMFHQDIFHEVLKGQKDIEPLNWERETEKKFWKIFEGEYLFTDEEKLMITQVKMMVSGRNVYAFFSRHPLEEKALFKEFTASFNILG